MLNSFGFFLVRLTTRQYQLPAVLRIRGARPNRTKSGLNLPKIACIGALTAVVAGCDSSGESSSTDNGGQIALDDDSLVYSMFEERRYEVLPGLGDSSEVNVESWRWNDSPFRFGPLVECSGLEGFESNLAVRNLSEACSVEDLCNFSFDQSDRVNDDGTTSPAFVVEVPTLKAPIGLAYTLRGLTDTGDTVNSSATFCLVPINEAPIAVDDAFTVVQGELLQIDSTSAINLLSNDTDDDDRSNASLAVATTPLTSPQLATQFSLGVDGGFTYLFDGDLSAQGGNTITDTFRYQISDGINTSFADVRITVVSRNNPPTINSEINNHTAVVGIPTVFDFSSSFSDPEGSLLEYSVVQGSLPANSNFDVSVLGVLTGTATPNDVGNYTVTAVANDGVSTASGNFLLTIVENQPPNVSTLNDLFVSFGTLINIDVSGNFQDPENIPLSYTLLTEPASDLVINPQTGFISGNLLEEGAYEITVSASDGVNEAVSSTFQITQNERPNRAPVFSGTISNQGVLLGETPTPVSGEFSDLDEDTLSYSISSLPPGMSFNESTGILSGTPEQLGVYDLTITAMDDSGATATSNAFTITVSAVPNEAPTFDSPIADMTLTEGVAITPFTAVFTDPEGQALSYTSTALPQGLVLNADTGEVTGTPTSPGIFNITITAQDDSGNTSDSNSFAVTVEPPANVAPVFTGTIADIAVTVGTAISAISGEFTDTDSLTYSSTTLPVGLTLNTTTGVITGTPSVVGTISVSLSATDPSGDTATSNSFDIVVTAVANNPPTFLGTIPDQSAVSGSAISVVDVSGFFSDIDAADTLVYTVNAANPLPTGLTLSEAGLISGTPTAIGTFAVVVTATDDAGDSISSTAFDYTISSDNVAPVIANRTPAGTINLIVGESETIEFDVTDEALSSVDYDIDNSSSAASLVTVAAGEYEVTGATEGTSILTFTVTDAEGLSDTEEVTVNVTEPDDNPPQIESVIPTDSSVEVEPGTPLSVAIAVTDESVSTLVYTAASSNTDVATVSSDTGGNFTVTALPTSTTSPGGTSDITFTVTDAAGQTDFYTLTVTVAAPVANLAPTIDNRTPSDDPITSIQIGDTDTIALVVTDEDAASLEYAAGASPAGVVSVSSVGDGTFEVEAVASGTATITLTVTDDVGQFDSVVFDVEVAEENLAPLFTGPISDVSYEEGDAITTLDVGVFFSDPNDDPLTFSHTLLPDGLSMDDAGVISGTPTVTGEPSVTTVTVTATDSAGSSADSNPFTITIEISAINQAPVFAGPIPDETFQDGELISPVDMAQYFSDTEGDAITLSSSPFPTGLSMDSAGLLTGTPTLTDPLASTETTDVIVTAMDLGSEMATDSNMFTITIASN